MAALLFYLPEYPLSLQLSTPLPTLSPLSLTPLFSGPTASSPLTYLLTSSLLPRMLLFLPLSLLVLPWGCFWCATTLELSLGRRYSSNLLQAFIYSVCVDLFLIELMSTYLVRSTGGKRFVNVLVTFVKKLKLPSDDRYLLSVYEDREERKEREEAKRREERKKKQEMEREERRKNRRFREGKEGNKVNFADKNKREKENREGDKVLPGDEKTRKTRKSKKKEFGMMNNID